MNAIFQNRLVQSILLLLAVAAVAKVVWDPLADLHPRQLPWLAMVMAALFIAASIGYHSLLSGRDQKSVGDVTTSTLIDVMERHREEHKRAAVLLDGLSDACHAVTAQIALLTRSIECLDHRLENLAAKLLDNATEARPIRNAIGMEAGMSSLSAVVAVSEKQPALGGTLKAAWKRYQEHGDGHFNLSGWKAELARSDVEADVLAMNDVDDAVLGVVDPYAEDGSFFVVPDFTMSPESVVHWFEDQSTGRLGGRIDDLRKLARGRMVEGRIEVLEKGAVA